MTPLRLTLLATLLALGALACGPDSPPDVCGLSGVKPETDEVLDGFASAQRDGEAWQEAGTWSPGPNAALNLGLLILTVAADETGTETTDLVARRAFPICIPLGLRSETSGNASFDGRFLTDASHGGSVAILGEQGGHLLGRFELELKDNNGTDTTAFTEGAFRVPRQ